MFAHFKVFVWCVLTMMLISVAQAEFAVDVNADGVALKGHDPVAYFTDNKPVPGNADYSAEHNGATYHFASAANRDLFTADPDKYAPQFGGFCAFGTTFTKKVVGDPQSWKVVDGKLFINSGPGAHERWLEDVSGNITKANGIWEQIKDKDPATL